MAFHIYIKNRYMYQIIIKELNFIYHYNDKFSWVSLMKEDRGCIITVHLTNKLSVGIWQIFHIKWKWNTDIYRI